MQFPRKQRRSPTLNIIPLIDVLEEDAVTDDGQELFNVLQQRDIVDVVVMGVHTNGCLLGRPTAYAN